MSAEIFVAVQIGVFILEQPIHWCIVPNCVTEGVASVRIGVSSDAKRGVIVKNIIAGLVVLFVWANPALAQEVESEPEPESIWLPFNVELKKPIIFDVTLTTESQGLSFVANETTRLTPLKQNGDNVIYEAETLSGKMISAEGLPPFLYGLLEQIAEDVTGMKYQYVADSTGYPLELTDDKKIKSFMRKMGRALKKWAKKFGKAEKLSDQQIAQMEELIDGSILPFQTGDSEAMTRLMLDEAQLLFSGTGRELYVGYYALSDSSRYFEPGEAEFQTEDSWLLASHDEETGEAVLQFTQTLNDEWFQGFLARYRALLEEQNDASLQPQIDAAVEKYARLQLNREGEFVIDLTTGWPKSGMIRSEQVYDGASEIETVEFTTRY